MGTLTLRSFASIIVLFAASTVVATDIPASITTADKYDTRIGTLEFKDGMPNAATLEKVYDNLDRAHAFDAFVNTLQGVNMAAIHKGFLDAGVKDNEIMIFSKLMDANSLFLTANADTVYALGVLDLTTRAAAAGSTTRPQGPRSRGCAVGAIAG